MTRRRKHAELVRFFKGVIRDDRASMKLKMQAAARLDDLFARNEAAEQQALARQERAELRAAQAAAVTASAPVEAIDPDEDEADRARNVFDSILKPKGADANAD